MRNPLRRLAVDAAVGFVGAVLALYLVGRLVERRKRRDAETAIKAALATVHAPTDLAADFTAAVRRNGGDSIPPAPKVSPVDDPTMYTGTRAVRDANRRNGRVTPTDYYNTTWGG